MDNWYPGSSSNTQAAVVGHHVTQQDRQSLAASFRETISRTFSEERRRNSYGDYIVTDAELHALEKWLLVPKDRRGDLDLSPQNLGSLDDRASQCYSHALDPAVDFLLGQMQIVLDSFGLQLLMRQLSLIHI